MCLLLWWHSVKHQQFYRDCLGGSSSRKEDLIACPAIQKKEIDFIIFGVSIIAKTNMLKCLTFWRLLAFGDRYSNYWYNYWASMSGSFQTLDSMFPKDPFFPDYFFQIIQTSIFRAWLVRDTMHLQVLDFNKNGGLFRDQKLNQKLWFNVSVIETPKINPELSDFCCKAWCYEGHTRFWFSRRFELPRWSSITAFWGEVRRYEQFPQDTA